MMPILSWVGVKIESDGQVSVEHHPFRHLLRELYNVVWLLWPFVVAGYAIYRLLTWVGPGQRSVTIAFVGGLLVKTFLIPFIKGIVTGALFKWFMGWLRGNKAKPA
jgi:hypothetical protein